jgi:hypothetical protein
VSASAVMPTAQASKAKRPAMASITFLDAMDSPALFRPWFKPESSWAAWRAFAKALFGLPMTHPEVEVFCQRTGRSTPPTDPAREAWVPVGRRGGKSLFAAALAVYMACLRDYRPYLKPGERAIVMVLAADKDQAGVVFDYIAGFFDNIPALAGLIEHRGKAKESIRLRNRVTIRVQVASFRRLRGRTVACAILDECAFWYADEESRNPDNEVLKALRPSMLTIPGSLLIAISSPYAKRGILWDAFRRYFGKDNARVLVWKADTVSMNPSVDREVIDEAYAEDPASARAEYGAEFRDDIVAFVGAEAVEAVTVSGRAVLPFAPGHRYVAFSDPAGGSGGDSMTLAIARREGRKSVVCRVAEWKPPFSPDEATAECAEILKEYGLMRVTGDHYAGDWPKDRFRAHGIDYLKADRTKSDFYQALLPLINGQRIELLDHKRTNGQLLALEKSTSRLGKDSISHPPNGHDDLINAVAGAAVLVQRRQMLEDHPELPAKSKQQEGSAMVETITRCYATCGHCGSQHLVDTPGDEPSCPQRGWSFGPAGARYATGLRTIEDLP